MKKQDSSDKVKKISLLKRIKHKIYFWFRLIDRPVVKVYNGYGNMNSILVMGHVLKLSPMPRKTYRKNWATNFFSVIRLFITAPIPNAIVVMKWGDIVITTHSEKDGFFKFEIKSETTAVAGWHTVTVVLNSENLSQNGVSGSGQVFIPYTSHHAFISDIDDTFLISHSSRIRRRLYVLFTKNERTRKHFDGVINHYNALAAGQAQNQDDAFFYVSSSEWNLYDYIAEFVRFNHLPKGIFLLGQMKQLKDFWKSGQNNHATKFMRIVRIIEQYPDLKFVLLGDDSQQDPFIYNSIVSHFPHRIIAVYIRKVHSPNFKKVSEEISAIKNMGVKCCYFEHSIEAMAHSKKIGLIENSNIRLT
ncbi:MAG: App1 family protein [Ginsengibacter sp.]